METPAMPEMQSIDRLFSTFCDDADDFISKLKTK